MPRQIYTLDQRCEMMRQRREKKLHPPPEKVPQVPHYLASPQRRRRRLEIIQTRMGLPSWEFARMLGISQFLMESIRVGRRTCSIPVLLLAEEYFKKFLKQYRSDMKNGYINSNAENKLPISAEIAENDKLRADAVLMFYEGASNDEIASKLAISPEAVIYFLKNCE